MSFSPLTYAVFLSFRIYTVVGAIVPLSPVFNIVGGFGLSFPTKILVGTLLVLNLFPYPDPPYLDDKFFFLYFLLKILFLWIRFAISSPIALNLSLPSLIKFSFSNTSSLFISIIFLFSSINILFLVNSSCNLLLFAVRKLSRTRIALFFTSQCCFNCSTIETTL